MSKFKSNKELLASAKELLKRGFVKGHWVVFPDIGVWKPGYGMHALKNLIEDAKEKQANPNCHVCAEGAVYMACVLDGDLTDARAKWLINRLDDEFRYRGLTRAQHVNDAGDLLVDNLQQVVGIFDRVEESLIDV